MLILSPTYRQALKNAGLDTQTYPISDDNGWDSDSLTFDSDLAGLSFGDTDFSAVTNLNVALPASLEAMLGSVADTSVTKGAVTNVSSSESNSASIQVKSTQVNSLAASSMTNLQTTAYDNNIISDLSMALDNKTGGYDTNINSDVAHATTVQVVNKDLASQVKSKKSSVETKSYIIALR